MKSKYLFLGSCLFIVFGISQKNICVASDPGKFNLITVLYNEKNAKRVDEYISCFEKNLAHECIDEICVVYDRSGDFGETVVLDFLKSKHIKIVYVDGRPSYGFCFDLANKIFPDSKVILSNADIYFNETLNLLSDYDLTNKFLAITRWAILEDGRIEPYVDKQGKPNIFSQDTWIFKTPLKKFKNDAIEIGVPACDGRIAFQARKEGLQILNPCLSVQCCHLHASEIRNYSFSNIQKHEVLSVGWEKLPLEKKKASWNNLLRSKKIYLYAGDIPQKRNKVDERYIGLSLARNDERHICHDITFPMPLPDNCVDVYQAEDVFEHIEYEKLPYVINEICRVLKPGGLFRLSIPDYRCDILFNRSVKDVSGKLIFDAVGGGKYENGRVLGGGHVWFPLLENVRALLQSTHFYEQGMINYLHYYDESGRSITHSIDYTKGFISRTPDHDKRVQNPYRGMSLVVDLYKKQLIKI